VFPTRSPSLAPSVSRSCAELAWAIKMVVIMKVKMSDDYFKVKPYTVFCFVLRFLLHGKKQKED
jgi:hypothetical protein